MNIGHGMNEAFVPNTTGKTITVDVQPYRSFTGTLTKITPRKITVSEFDINKGRCQVTYEVFDCEVTVTEGREVRSLVAGVPQGSHDIAGHVERITLGFGDLHKGAHKGEVVVKVCCG